MSMGRMMSGEHRLVKGMGLRPHVALSAVSDTHEETKKEVEGGALG
jgi:hypothetical protein